jgi:hypothetical protein
MEPGIRTTGTCLAALLLGAGMASASAAGLKGMSESGMSFKDFDANKDGYLSLEEFKAKGKDDLAFKAADLDGDGRLDPEEFDKYLARKASDPATSESGAGGQPKPPQPRTGY